jgi:uncharacterized protein YjlB
LNNEPANTLIRSVLCEERAMTSLDNAGKDRAPGEFDNAGTDVLPAAERFVLAPDGDIPNSPLPLLYYHGALAPALLTPGAAQALFRENDWVGNWVDGIFDYWHFHVGGHEVLGCVAGEAEVGFGGDAGIRFTFRAGDVVAIPAGVGHRRLSEKRGGFTIVGGYPPGQNGTVTRPGELDGADVARRIAAIPLPHSDPVFGYRGPVMEAWNLR